MPTIHQTYEAKMKKLNELLAKRLKRYYNASITEITIMATGITNATPTTFKLSSYPQLRQKIADEIRKLHGNIFDTVIEGVNKSWKYSNEKNDVIVDRRLAGKEPSAKGKMILYDSNEKALDQFLARKRKGLNLSGRVWKTLEPFPKQLEQALGLMVGEGKGAKAMATEIKQYLNEPDRLYRKVRGEDGKLILSKAAREYKPGRGVYRSSYKNALRLTRTETNMAYRYADFERWQKLPFVTGIRIKISNRHIVYDICDPLQGLYPKDFKFAGWHSQCLCSQTPEMMDDKEYSKFEDQILAGTADLSPKLAHSSPPKAFGEYIAQNKEKIKGWASLPYWALDNPQYTKQLRK